MGNPADLPVVEPDAEGSAPSHCGGGRTLDMRFLGFGVGRRWLSLARLRLPRAQTPIGMGSGWKLQVKDSTSLDIRH